MDGPKVPVPVPERMRGRPVDPVRGLPVPWFVQWIDGKPEFRVAGADKRVTAIKQNRCWVCGAPLRLPGNEWQPPVFVIGPMCLVNRVSAEPPCHVECAEYSAKACPFLAKPHMVRRGEDDAVMQSTAPPPGVMVKRNPGVVCLLASAGYRLFTPPGGGPPLLNIGAVVWVRWFREGRPATRAEVQEATESGIPHLLGDEPTLRDVAQLREMVASASRYWPAEVPPP
jgi:hypothetical protein